MAAMHRSMHESKGPEELYNNFPEPVPDYDDDSIKEGGATSDFPPPPPPLTAEQLSEAVSQAHNSHLANGDMVSSDEFSRGSDGLLQPKPLANPCLSSKDRQALHKELLMNSKRGTNVLEKPELNKVLDKRRATQKKKEAELQKPQMDHNSLEFKLKERADKLKEDEEKTIKAVQENDQVPEFVKMQRRMTHSKHNSGES